MGRQHIRACMKCEPPKRQLGCHSKCEAYLAEKEVREKELEVIRKKRSLKQLAFPAHAKEFVRKVGQR